MAPLLFDLIWRPLGDRHHAAPLLFYSPFFVLFLLCNLSPSQKRLRTIGACILTLLWLLWPFQFSLFANPLQDDPTGDTTHYGVAYFCMAFTTLDRLVFTDLESFQRVTDQVKDGKKVLEPVPKPWTWKRCKWTISLIFSYRGVGWNWEVKNTPAPREKCTRTRLLTEIIFLLFVRVLISEAIFAGLALWLSEPLALTSIWSLPWAKQIDLTALSVFNMVLISPFSGDLVCVLSLLFSNAPVDQYRSIWGNLSSLHSLGTAWGTTWHQGLRRIATRPACLLLDKLRVPRGTFWYLASYIVISFTITGMAHMWSMLVAGTGGWRTLAFFELQAAGVIVEAALSVLSPWSSPLWLKRAWAVAFLLATAPLYLEDGWKAGHWSQGNPDASVLLPLYSFATGKDMNWSGMLEDLRYRLGKA